jgi:pimeloyl-ACP methyl ester carboxylesterase
MNQSTPINLVLLPGLDGTGLLFKPLLDCLPSHFKITVISYPKQEFLTLDQQIHHIQNQLPLQAFYLLAESYSGSAAIRMATLTNTPILGLILCSTFARNPRPSLQWTSPFLPFIPFQLFSTRLLSRLLFRRPNLKLTNLLHQALQDIPNAVLQKRFQAVIHNNSTKFLSLIKTPTLVLQASDDWLVPKHCGQNLKQLITDSTLLELKGGHGLLQENPSRAANAIKQWMESLI